MIATVTLNPSIDQIFGVRMRKTSDSSRAEKVDLKAAGKGINVSKTIRKLGGRTEAFAILGGAFGREFERLAAIEKVRVHTRKVREDTRINVTIDDLESDREIRVLAPGPHATVADSEALLKMVSAGPRFFALVLSGCASGGARAPGNGPREFGGQRPAGTPDHPLVAAGTPAHATQAGPG